MDFEPAASDQKRNLRIRSGKSNSRDRSYIPFPEAPFLAAISSASTGLEVGQAVVSVPLHRDIDNFQGYFRGVRLGVVSDSGLKALLEIM